MKIEPQYTTAKITKLLNAKGFDEDAPQIWHVLEWLRVKYGIWIYVRDFETLPFCAYVTMNGNIEHSITNGYESPKDAYLAAIEYTLNSNLLSDGNI